MPARAAIYLDANAGAPLCPEALEALRALINNPTGELIANPSSPHEAGRRSRSLLDLARAQVATSLNLPGDDSLVFTSSGTEANQLAVRGALERAMAHGKRISWVTTVVEHDSVRALIPWAREQEIEVVLVGLDSAGRPDPEELAHAVAREAGRVALVSMIVANSETGVLTDVTRCIATIRDQAPTALVHLDAAQAWGKIPLDAAELGADLIAVAGHKIGALAGTGALALATARARATISAASSLLAGSQESSRRGGTENLAGIVTLGAAAAAMDPVATAERLRPMRDRFEAKLLAARPEVVVHGATAPRIANTSHFRVRGIEEGFLVPALDLAGFCVSSGPACSSRAAGPSPTLIAMGLPESAAKSAVRVSLPAGVSESDIERFADQVVRIAGAKLARTRGLAVAGASTSSEATA